jgi:hypothetical protein
LDGVSAIDLYFSWALAFDHSDHDARCFRVCEICDESAEADALISGCQRRYNFNARYNQCDTAYSTTDNGISEQQT